MEDYRSIPDGGMNHFLCHCFPTGYGTHTAAYPLDKRASYPGDEVAKCENDTSLNSSEEVKKDFICV